MQDTLTTAGSGTGANGSDAAELTVATDRQVIQVIEERLEVGKRWAEPLATVRLRKVVHHDTVVAEQALAVETVEVQRVAIGRIVDGPVAIRHEGDVMIVPVVEERLVTVTQRVLVEEIHIHKRSRIEPSRQEVSLRREEVIVERLHVPSGEWRPVVESGDAADLPPAHGPPRSAAD